MVFLDNNAVLESNVAIYITERELATRWRRSQRSVQRMRANGCNPPYLRLGRAILYRLEDIEAHEQALRERDAPK